MIHASGHTIFTLILSANLPCAARFPRAPPHPDSLDLLLCDNQGRQIRLWKVPVVSQALLRGSWKFQERLSEKLTHRDDSMLT